MGAGLTATIITASVASGGLKTGFGIRARRIQEEQERARQAQIRREQSEIVAQARLREGVRGRQLAGRIGLQVSALAGSGIIGGETAEQLRLSAELAAAVERRSDELATAGRLATLDEAIRQSDLAIREGKVQLTSQILSDTFATVSSVSQAVVGSIEETATKPKTSTASTSAAEPASQPITTDQLMLGSSPVQRA